MCEIVKQSTKKINNRTIMGGQAIFMEGKCKLGVDRMGFQWMKKREEEDDT